MSKNLEIFDNKLIILYVLEMSKKSLTLNELMSFFVEFENITYFDICTFVEELLAKDYIALLPEENYSITEKGTFTLNELLELIPGVNILSLKKIFKKNLIDVKKSYSIGSFVKNLQNNEFVISCFIKDSIQEYINISIHATSKEQAKQISQNWQDNYEEIHSYLLNKLTK